MSLASPPVVGTVLAPSGQTNVEYESWTASILQTLMSPSLGIANPTVRPLRANDLNSTYYEEFYNFSFTTAGTNQVVTSAAFSTQTGKAYCIYGYQDLTPGTKSITGIQVNINGKNVPLQNIPLTHAWTDTNAEVYFSPIYALQPNQALAVYVNGVVSSATVSFRILGFIVETGGNR